MVPITRSAKGFCHGERGRSENLGDADALHPSSELAAVDAVASGGGSAALSHGEKLR